MSQESKNVLTDFLLRLEKWGCTYKFDIEFDNPKNTFDGRRGGFDIYYKGERILGYCYPMGRELGSDGYLAEGLVIFPDQAKEYLGEVKAGIEEVKRTKKHKRKRVG